MTHRIRFLVLFTVVACVVPASMALATGGEPSATEPLGIHLDRTGFTSLMARGDGSLLALQIGGKREFSRRVQSYSADGTLVAEPGETAGEARLFPVAGGRYLALGYQKMTRLESDGTVDTSFGKGGSIVPPAEAKAAFELGSGEIAVVSTDVEGAKSVSAYLSVKLLNQDGQTIKGGVSTSLPSDSAALGGTISVPEIVPRGSGGALVIGQNFLLALEPDGSASTGFGESGLITGLGQQLGGAVLPDGSIETVDGGGEGVTLRRYTSSGMPEAGFGQNGVFTSDLGGAGAEVNAASWASDGSVIVGGRMDSNPACHRPEECDEMPFLAAFDAAGDLDPSFGQAGVLRLTALAGVPEGYESPGVTALARRPDGSIVAAGCAAPNETTGFLAAVTPAGALVPSFGEGGIVRRPEPVRASQEVVGFVPTPDGGLLAAGTTDVGIGERPALIRYLPDLTLDRSFGGGAGYTLLRNVPDGSPHGATGFAVDDEEVLVGNYDTPFSHVFMARASDGSPVATFGSDGTVDLPKETWATQLAFAGNGDPLVLGIHRESGPANGSVVLRYHPDGTLDAGFGNDGRFAMRLGRRPVRWKSIIGGPGESILLAGSLGDRFVLTSLLPDGKPDSSFGTHGSAVVKLPTDTHYATLARIASHIYLAGTYGAERTEASLALMRFDRHGHLDRGFGRAGLRLAHLEGASHAVAVLPTPSGPLVVLGNGRRPLLTFQPGGRVGRAPVGSSPRSVDDVRAAVTGSELTVGWMTYSRADRAQIFHLARRPLGGD